MSAPPVRPSRVVGDQCAITAPVGSEVSLPQLAHELNSLLDGSIRSLGLAERALDDTAHGPAGMTEALGRLRIAREALTGMAELLDRTLACGRASDVGIFTQQETLGAVAGRMVRTVMPLAAEHDVDIDSIIAPNAETLPARTLGPVILNALRNAIRSATHGSKPRKTRLEIQIDDERNVTIIVIDSGPGVPANFAIGRSGEADGHGIGLELSHRIVSDLGGTLSLANASSGGARLCVVIPARSLERP